MNISTDRYPMDITAPDGMYLRVRLIAVDDERIVLLGKRDGGVHLWRDEHYSGLVTDGTTITVTLANGDEWRCVQGGGCGCGGDILTRLDAAAYLASLPDPA